VCAHPSPNPHLHTQVCVLTQLLLDPHYRTLDGLLTLLDKDVGAFGHKCADRLGFSVAYPIDSTEWSPVLLQLLDAIWQARFASPNTHPKGPKLVPNRSKIEIDASARTLQHSRSQPDRMGAGAAAITRCHLAGALAP
jgi:hypothetical protein